MKPTGPKNGTHEGLKFRTTRLQPTLYFKGPVLRAASLVGLDFDMSRSVIARRGESRLGCSLGNLCEEKHTSMPKASLSADTTDDL